MLKVFVITNKNLQDLTVKDKYGNEKSLNDWNERDVDINHILRLSDLFDPEHYKNYAYPVNTGWRFGIYPAHVRLPPDVGVSASFS